MDDNSLAVAYGGSLEIHPQSFKLVISLYVEGEETKNSGSDECRVNMLAFIRGGAKASQAARSVSLVTLRSPQAGAGFVPSFDYHSFLAGKVGRADLRCFPSTFPHFLAAWILSFLWFLSSPLPFTACDGVSISG